MASVAGPPDLELEPIGSEDEDYQSAPPDYQVATYPADYTLDGLHRKWQLGELIVPDFQRKFVWTQAQASKLIESFLVGLPVPAVFFYRERESKKFLVIDGQQRLKSTFFFFEGYFGLERSGRRPVFRLKGLSESSRFFERTFDELAEENQRELRDSVLRAFIVQQLNPQDDTSMYHIFERLNTGGTLLANQEVRDCVYHGKFSQFLGELNELDSWREILGKPKPDPRKRDLELALRFLAMRDSRSYTHPMKDYLSRFMYKNRSPSAEMCDGSRHVFERTCEAVVSGLGERPFHIRRGLNAAVFDSVMCAFSNHLGQVPQDIRGRYKALISDPDFDKNTRQSTTNVDVVRGRLRQAETRLFGR